MYIIYVYDIWKRYMYMIYVNDMYIYMVGAGIIERKLRSTKVRLFTVPCCSIILFSSEGVKKKYPNLLLTFFVVYNSCPSAAVL